MVAREPGYRRGSALALVYSVLSRSVGEIDRASPAAVCSDAVGRWSPTRRGDALSAEMCRRGCTTNGGRFGDGQTNGVCPGMAMGRMGKSMSQIRSSGTSFSWEFIAWSQVISCPV